VRSEGYILKTFYLEHRSAPNHLLGFEGPPPNLRLCTLIVVFQGRRKFRPKITQAIFLNKCNTFKIFSYAADPDIQTGFSLLPQFSFNWGHINNHCFLIRLGHVTTGTKFCDMYVSDAFKTV
jgi:hypothetical protein